MLRMRFVKSGSAIWISHLDLMRLLMRAFRRAGYMLKHSQGYSPHPELSILLPLSVGVSSQCELADFELECPADDFAQALAEPLNRVMPEGIRVLEVYPGGEKAGKLAFLRALVFLDYDAGVPEGAQAAVEALFERPSLPVEKHGKKGPVELDIRPMIRELRCFPADRRTLVLDAVVTAQNPTLNPMLLAAAVEAWLPELRPDCVRCTRIEVYDREMRPFR